MGVHFWPPRNARLFLDPPGQSFIIYTYYTILGITYTIRSDFVINLAPALGMFSSLGSFSNGASLMATDLQNLLRNVRPRDGCGGAVAPWEEPRW